MADRLSDLLHREAEGLDVPPPRDHEALTEGRRLRRRRSATVLAAGVAAALVVVGGVGFGSGVLRGDGGRTDAATDPPATMGAVFAAGTTVYYDDGARSVQVDGPAVGSLSYTSDGVVVGQGRGSAQRYSLLTASGELRSLSVAGVTTTPASDPDEPYLVWAEPEGAEADVVVWDVETDIKVMDVPVPGADAAYLPVALDGWTAYVGSDFTTWAVDWRTGPAEVSPLLGGGTDVADGRGLVLGGQGGDAVRDLDTGETLWTQPVPQQRVLDLSPDGRFVTTLVEEGVSFDVNDVDTGDHVTIEGNAYQFGWTSDGDVFRVNGDTVTTCSSETGTCTDTTVTQPVPRRSQVVLGGVG